MNPPSGQAHTIRLLVYPRLVKSTIIRLLGPHRVGHSLDTSWYQQPRLFNSFRNFRKSRRRTLYSKCREHRGPCIGVETIIPVLFREEIGGCSIAEIFRDSSTSINSWSNERERAIGGGQKEEHES